MGGTKGGKAGRKENILFRIIHEPHGISSLDINMRIEKLKN